MSIYNASASFLGNNVGPFLDKMLLFYITILEFSSTRNVHGFVNVVLDSFGSPETTYFDFDMKVKDFDMVFETFRCFILLCSWAAVDVLT